MDRLWAPWRLEYIVEAKTEGCVFCESHRQDEDEKNHILHRGQQAFVIMNAFPYSNGHLLIAPYSHIGDLADLTDDQSLEIMRLSQKCCEVLRRVCAPDGFNLGVNLGAAAGAGITDHVHMHIVPRWSGDTNFMPVFADVKVIPEALDATYKKLKAGFDKWTE